MRDMLLWNNRWDQRYKWESRWNSSGMLETKRFQQTGKVYTVVATNTYMMRVLRQILRIHVCCFDLVFESTYINIQTNTMTWRSICYRVNGFMELYAVIEIQEVIYWFHGEGIPNTQRTEKKRIRSYIPFLIYSIQFKNQLLKRNKKFRKGSGRRETVTLADLRKNKANK